MILVEKTVEDYGYEPESLSNGSNKRICVQCDYCQLIYTTTMKQRNHANKHVDKDACKKCRFKKRSDISMAKYGVDNPSKLESVKQKVREKNIDRLQSEEYKQQIKETNLRKYGCKSAMNNEKIKEKHRQTFQRKYGVDNPSQLTEVQEKRKATCKERFGTEYASQSEKGKELIIQGFQKKYGVDNAFQSEEVKAKIKETTVNRYGVDHHIKIPGKAQEIRDKTLATKIANGDVKIYNNQTYAMIAKSIGFSSSHFYTLVNKYGIEKAITLTPMQSSLEILMAKLLDDFHIEYTQQFRVDSKIADFFIPSHNLIIECDGLYWHSDAVIKDNNYHVKKRQLYIDHGYMPLFFREDELNNKLPIVKSIIMNKLGLCTRLGARKCELTELDNDAGKKFVEENHLMGKGSGRYFALKFNGEIMSVLNIKRVRDRQHEVSRFCSKGGYSISGAFSRLMKFALSQLDASELITFIDLRYGRGSYLSNFGFSQKSTYPSFRWTNGLDCFHRMKFPGNSGYENGLVKLWDCGQSKWILTF